MAGDNKAKAKITLGWFGFAFGPARVTRLCSHPKHGVWIMVGGDREMVEIRVTKGGRIRIGKVEKTTAALRIGDYS